MYKLYVFGLYDFIIVAYAILIYYRIVGLFRIIEKKERDLSEVK